MAASVALKTFVMGGYARVNAYNEEIRQTSWPSHQGLNAIANILTGQYTCTSVIQHPDASSGRLVCTSNQGLHNSFQADMSLSCTYMAESEDTLACVPQCQLKLYDVNDDQQQHTITEQCLPHHYKRKRDYWQLQGPSTFSIRFSEGSHPMLLTDVHLSGELNRQVGLSIAASGSQRTREEHGVDLDGLRLRTMALSIHMSKIALCTTEAQKPDSRHVDITELWLHVHQCWGKILKASIANKMAQVLCKKGETPNKTFRDEVADFFAKLWTDYIEQLGHVTSGDGAVMHCQA